MIDAATETQKCHRKTMEDMIGCGKVNLDEKYDVFFVIDGHSGSDAAYFIQQNMIKFLEKNINYGIIESIIDKTFFDIDFGLRKNKIKGGAVISMILIGQKYLYIVSLGDCTVDLIDFGKNKKIFSEIHDCKNIFEVERIKKTGNNVFDNRVNGILEPTRAFGDFDFKKKIFDFLNPVSFKPSVIKYKIPKKFFIFLTSDGLHHMYDRIKLFDSLIKKIKQEIPLKKICSLLKEKAKQDNCYDNISFILIKDA